MQGRATHRLVHGAWSATALVALSLGCSTSASPQSQPDADAAGDTPGIDTAEGDVSRDTADASACGAEVARDGGALPTFERHTLDSVYRSEGVGVLDVDNDGRPDIVTDQRWYAGPSFTVSHEIRPPASWDPAAGYADCFGVYPQDLDHDGYLDIIVAPHVGNAMYWYRNPGGKDVAWSRYLITPAGVAGLENAIVAPLFADGPPVLVMTDTVRGLLGWYTPPGDPTQPWELHPISAKGFVGAPTYTHGIGVGDVNGDGRPDALFASGWYEQPVDRTSAWPQHSFAFGAYLSDPRACHRMWTYDVNGDHLADVFCSRPHDYGIHWFEQRPSATGSDAVFVDHVIDDKVSQMHALSLADLDGDGVPEAVSGKRFWAEGPGANPGVSDPAVLVYYRMHGSGAAVGFDKQVVDEDSGVGGAIWIADVDGDCKADIVTANKKGLFWFHQK